jgi:hypothetical protein
VREAPGWTLVRRLQRRCRVLRRQAPLRRREPVVVYTIRSPLNSHSRISSRTISRWTWLRVCHPSLNCTRRGRPLRSAQRADARLRQSATPRQHQSVATHSLPQILLWRGADAAASLCRYRCQLHMVFAQRAQSDFQRSVAAGRGTGWPGESFTESIMESGVQCRGFLQHQQELVCNRIRDLSASQDERNGLGHCRQWSARADQQDAHHG